MDSRLLRSILALVWAAGFALLTGTSNISRAQGLPDRIEITRLDTSQAPDIGLDARVVDATGAAVTDLQAGDFHLFDNGKPVPLTGLSQVHTGLQLGIMVDASETINRPGRSGQARIDEVREALAELLLQDGWVDAQNRTDWVMIAVQEPGGNQVVTTDDLYPQGWTNDYQLAYNRIYLYDSAQQKKSTSLFDGVTRALRSMTSLPASAGAGILPRSLLIFSDGVDQNSQVGLADVVTAAQRAGVTVHTVGLGQPQDDQATHNLEELARQTGGLYRSYSSAGSVQSIYDALAGQRSQYRLTYRLTSAGTHLLQIQATAGLAGSIAETTASFSDALAAPVVKVSALGPDSVFEIMPSQTNPGLPVTLQVTWPDGKPRSLAEAVYTLDEIRYTADQEPFDRFTLPMRNATDGQHVLRVEVTDELGLRARASDVQLTVRRYQPLTVSITNLAPGTIIRRQASGLWSDPAKAEPLTQPIEVSWDAVDGHERGVRTVELLVDDQSVWSAAPDQHPFQWDISQLASGSHTVAVRVEDELGLTAESLPIPVTLALGGPSLAMLANDYSLVILVVALAALVLVVFLLTRRRNSLSSAGRRISQKIHAATQPWRPDHMVEGKGAAAYLLVEEDGDGPAQPVPLVSANTRIGRDESLVNLQFEDLTVSRLHARISREPDGSYRVYDEGSTSGTYVNFQRVPMGGQLLRPNDLLQLGRLRLRFMSEDVRLRRAPAPLQADWSLAPAPTFAESEDLYDTQPWSEMPNAYVGRPGNDVRLQGDGEDPGKTEPYLGSH